MIFMIGSCTIKLLSQSQFYKDCLDAFPVCEKKSYHFHSTKGTGIVKDRIPELRSKADAFQETNSLWLKWKIKKAGDLSFIITPHDSASDLDFIVFKIMNGQCNVLKEVRSMVAGENIGEDVSSYINCSGTTGLTPYSYKEFDNAGCSPDSDNFLKALETSEGEEYMLLVNNFESESGFSISFEGSTELSIFEDCNKLSDGFEIINLFPNPGKDFVNVEYHALTGSPADFSVINNKGEILSTGVTELKPGKNSFTIQTENLSSGSYIIQIRQDKSVASRIFIKI